MALLLIGGGWFGFQEMQKRQIAEKRAGACAANPCGPGLRCDGSGGCIPRDTPEGKEGEVKSIPPPKEPWKDPDGDGVSKQSESVSGCPGDTYTCGGAGATFSFCLSKSLGKTCNESALEQGYTVPIGGGGPGLGGWRCIVGQKGYTGKEPCVWNNSVQDVGCNLPNCFCGTVQIDNGCGSSIAGTYKSECGCEGKDQGGTAAAVLPGPSPSPGVSPSPSPSPSVSCIDLTSNKTAPTMGDTVNFTCKADFSAAAPVAIFRHNISGGSYTESAQLPLNSSGEAGYSLTVNQTGNWSVQCRVCTDSTATTCTAWGQAQ